MSHDGADKHQTGIIDMVWAAVNTQRKGPSCTVLDLLLLCLDYLKSNFQITGFWGFFKMVCYCRAFLRSSQIQILIGFNLAWDFDWFWFQDWKCQHHSLSGLLTTMHKFLLFPVWTEDAWQLSKISKPENNIIPVFYWFSVETRRYFGLLYAKCTNHYIQW